MAQPHRTTTRDSCRDTISTDTRRNTRTPWPTRLALSAALLLLALPALVAAAPSTPSFHSSPALRLERRAIQYVDQSEQTIELTFEATGSYALQSLPINECVSNDKLVLPVSATTHIRNYDAITAPDPEMAINFYTDDQCKEYEFSVMSEVHEFAGAFASIKYVGQFTDVKPGVYDKQEISRTVFPEGEPQTTGFGSAPATSSDTATIPAPDSSTSKSGMASAGFAIGMGIVGFVAMAGIVGLGVFLYRKNDGFGRGQKKRGGDGRAFMTLSSGRDDYDDEVGLTGENGPHSSALMQSRVGVSFEDERYPAAEYHDEEHPSDDDQVELGAYPQNPAGPTQYREEPGTLPQNARSP